MPWRDQLSMQCPLCEAAFRASSTTMLRRILDGHAREAHGMPGTAALQALDPVPWRDQTA